MRIGELFAGYGGLGMGVQAVLGGDIVWHSEYEAAPSKILAHHWPDVPNHGDITTIDWATVEPVDVLTGGFPCQPVSHAGLRRGDEDERWLWDDFARAIRLLRPRLVVLENVRGLLTAGDGRLFGSVLGSLAELGYDTQWHGLRAADVGAPHGRFRVFVIATDADVLGYERARGTRGRWPRPADGSLAATDTRDAGLEVGRVEPDGPQRQTAERGHREPAPDADHGLHSDVCGGVARPEASRERRPQGDCGRPSDSGGGAVTWGPYAAAIHRWELVTGRPAPAPTEPGRTGNARLSPRFVEWMQGLPAGWVTDVPGVSRNDQLKALGNGVVPQQAEAAVRFLLNVQGAAA